MVLVCFYSLFVCSAIKQTYTTDNTLTHSRTHTHRLTAKLQRISFSVILLIIIRSSYPVFHLGFFFAVRTKLVSFWIEFDTQAIRLNLVVRYPLQPYLYTSQQCSCACDADVDRYFGISWVESLRCNCHFCGRRGWI